MEPLTTITANSTNQPAERLFPATEWVCLECVPVYREHTDEDGFTFDRAALDAVAESCNRRIRETGDYCPLTDGHTPKPTPFDTAPAAQPPVLGFAGPYFVVRLGDVKPFWAIATHMWVRHENVERVRQLPRRSVELWKVGDDPSGWFFDPIALLGSKTPKLDLGLAYSRTLAEQTVLVRRYEAGFASPTNAFIPTNESDKRRNNAPEKPAMALSEDDLKQLVGAFDQLDWVQWVKKQMANETAAAANTPPDAGDEGAGAPPPVDNSKTRNEMPEGNVDPTKETPPEGKVVQNARSGAAEHYARLDRDNQLLMRRVAELEAGNVRVKREAKIDGLRLEYSFDDEKAKKRAGGMTDEQFADWCEDVVKHYSRIPANEMVALQTPTPGRIAQEFTAADRQKVVDLCARENIGWAAGMAKFQASKQ